MQDFHMGGPNGLHLEVDAPNSFSKGWSESPSRRNKRWDIGKNPVIRRMVLSRASIARTVLMPWGAGFSLKRVILEIRFSMARGSSVSFAVQT